MTKKKERITSSLISSYWNLLDLSRVGDDLLHNLHRLSSRLCCLRLSLCSGLHDLHLLAFAHLHGHRSALKKEAWKSRGWDCGFKLTYKLRFDLLCAFQVSFSTNAGIDQVALALQLTVLWNWRRFKERREMQDCDPGPLVLNGETWVLTAEVWQMISPLQELTPDRRQQFIKQHNFIWPETCSDLM